MSYDKNSVIIHNTTSPTIDDCNNQMYSKRDSNYEFSRIKPEKSIINIETNNLETELINITNDKKSMKEFTEPLKEERIRKDIYGNIIKKGAKKKLYKVTFIDKTLFKPLTEVIEIESHKNYTNNDYMNYKTGGVNCNCACNII